MIRYRLRTLMILLAVEPPRRWLEWRDGRQRRHAGCSRIGHGPSPRRATDISSDRRINGGIPVRLWFHCRSISAMGLGSHAANRDPGMAYYAPARTRNRMAAASNAPHSECLGIDLLGLRSCFRRVLLAAQSNCLD